MDSRIACILKSGEVSIKIFVPSSMLISEEHRDLLFFGLSEWHTAHSHPITGVPALEPAPKTVTIIAIVYT
jgi:hypothetical protein